MHTFFTKKDAKGKKGTTIVIIKETRAEIVIKILHKIRLKQRRKVE